MVILFVDLQGSILVLLFCFLGVVHCRSPRRPFFMAGHGRAGIGSYTWDHRMSNATFQSQSSLAVAESDRIDPFSKPSSAGRGAVTSILFMGNDRY
jgi:hypothetical protein